MNIGRHNSQRDAAVKEPVGTVEKPAVRAVADWKKADIA